MDVDAVLAELFALISPHLTEKQRRLLLGAGARALGRGGGARMARISAMARPTVYAGVRELDMPADPQGRIRRPGGGPKRLAGTDPGLLAALEGLVDPDTRGDPGSPLRWTTKSTRQLAEALTAQGHPVSDDTVGRLLKQQGYRLQRTAKTLEGAQHPDRDGQLGQRRLGQRRGRPRHRRVRGGHAAPLVAEHGQDPVPGATRLLVTADAGGSNGHRVRAWKAELARFAAETGLEVTVCHFPPGTSKWDRIEHRLFSATSMTWRGRPLVGHQVIVALIGATRTRSGLRARAALDRGRYPLGVRVSDQQLAAVPIRRHQWHGEWNYTILPEAA